MSDRVELLRRLWDLRRHPFDPRVAPELERLEVDVYAHSLDPSAAQGILSYYHDIYDWESAKIVGPIPSDDEGCFFPDPADLIEPHAGILLLVAGVGLTGRHSLVNYVLYTFEKERGVAPLVVDPSLSHSGPQNEKLVAQRFLLRCCPERDSPLKKDLRTVMKEGTEAAPEALPPYYPGLFDNMKLAAGLEDVPIVVTVKGPDRYSLWDEIYRSLKEFADLVIVTTKDVEEARMCKRTMDASGQNAALIHAPELNEKMARQYLCERLARDRVAGRGLSEDTYAPFAEEALEALYKRTEEELQRLEEARRESEKGRVPQGRGAGGGEESEQLQWSVGWLNRTFRYAIDQHLSELEKAPPAGGGDDPAGEPCTIGSDRILEARKAIDRGRRR